MFTSLSEEQAEGRCSSGWNLERKFGPSESPTRVPTSCSWRRGRAEKTQRRPIPDHPRRSRNPGRLARSRPDDDAQADPTRLPWIATHASRQARIFLMESPRRPHDDSFQPHNCFVKALLTDMYQLTMAYAYWRSERHTEPAVFEVFFRKHPFKGEFTLFAGLEEVR